MSSEGQPYQSKMQTPETPRGERLEQTIQSLPLETIKSIPISPELEVRLNFIPFVSRYDPDTHPFPVIVNLVNKNGRVIFSEENFILELEELFKTQIAPILQAAGIDYIGETVRIIGVDGGIELNQLEGGARGRSVSFKVMLDDGTEVIVEIVDHHNAQIKESTNKQLTQIITSKVSDDANDSQDRKKEILIISGEAVRHQDPDATSSAVLPHLKKDLLTKGSLENMVLEIVGNIIDEIDITAGMPNWQKEPWGKKVKILIFQWIVFFYSNYYNIHKKDTLNLVGNELILLNKSKANLELLINYLIQQVQQRNIKSLDLLKLSKEERMDLVINLTLGEGILARDWIAHLENTGLMLQLQALHDDTEFGGEEGRKLAHQRNPNLLNPRPLINVLAAEFKNSADINIVCPEGIYKKFTIDYDGGSTIIYFLREEKRSATKLALPSSDIIIIPRIDKKSPKCNVSSSTTSIYPEPEHLKIKGLVESALNCIYSATTERFLLGESEIKVHIQFPGALMSGAKTMGTGDINTRQRQELATYLAITAVKLACKDLDITKITQQNLIQYLSLAWNSLRIENSQNLNLQEIGSTIREAGDKSISSWLSGV